MFSLIVLFFVVYTVAMGFIVSLGFRLQKKTELTFFSEENGIDLNEITVLIPFRNEENRLKVLLDSIKGSSFLPKEYIFIDDHSNDKSVELIESELKGVRFQILSLPEGITGKKNALRFAIEEVKTKYILTLDADVRFENDYFESLSKLENSDMYILPAIMEADKPFEYFYEIDVVLVNAINTGLAGISRPIVCSGANLLYRKDIFDEVDDFSSHEHMASGDDTYLLRDFRENGKEVRLVSNSFCAIKTETPQSFRAFIDQRLRWIGKTGDMKDNLSSGLAIIQSVFTLSFFTLLIYAIALGLWKVFVVLFIIKSAIDLVLFAPFFSRINRRITWLFLPVYELLFPIYTLIILSLVFVYKPEWKGRGIVKNKRDSRG